MDFTKTQTFKEIVLAKKRVYFVSPHFDDAIFSCGQLLWMLRKNKVPVTVINIFTKASKKPYTRSAKKFLASCGYTDVNALYKDRETEDKQVIKKVGAKIINLGFTDAIWRKIKVSNILKSLVNIIPEIAHVYPILSLSMRVGRVSGFDKALEAALGKRLTHEVGKNQVVFCPVGIGGHPDHLVTRDVCASVFDKVILWEDYPYSTWNPSDVKFAKRHGLNNYFLPVSSIIKSGLVNGYKSQIVSIFGVPKAHIASNEKYYIKD